MSNTTWQLNPTAIRSRSVAPTHGFGKGDVCPQAAGYITGFTAGSAAAPAMRKRHLDAVQATPVWGRKPWSPPVR